MATGKHPISVIPAQAGIQRTVETLRIFNRVWIPAFAGMTVGVGAGITMWGGRGMTMRSGRCALNPGAGVARK